MQGSLDLGRASLSGRPGSPSSLLFRGIKVPWQKPLMSAGTLPPAAAHCSKYHVKPVPGIELPQRQRGKDREHRRRLAGRSIRNPSHRSSSAPPPDLAHVVPSCYCPSESVVIHEPASALPNALAGLSKAFRHGVARIRPGQFGLHLRLHLGHGPGRRLPSASANAAASFWTAKRRSLSRYSTRIRRSHFQGPTSSNSGQPLPTRMKSRRYMAQQKARTQTPSLTQIIAL